MSWAIHRWKVWYISIIKKKRGWKRIKIGNGTKIWEVESFIKKITKNNNNRRWYDGEFNACKIDGLQKRW